MIAVRRLVGVAAFLAVLALLTSTDVWGEPRDKELDKWHKGDGKNKPAAKVELLEPAEEPEQNRFANVPVVSYQDRDGRFFALQVQPKFAASDDRPVDYLVMIDT